MPQSRPRVAEKIREKIFKESGYQCIYCGGFANEIDHIFPWSFEQVHRKENLVACCRVCNGIASDFHFDSFAEKITYVQRVCRKRNIKPDPWISPTISEPKRKSKITKKTTVSQPKQLEKTLDKISKQEILELEIDTFDPAEFLKAQIEPLLLLTSYKCNKEIKNLGIVLAQKINRSRGPFSISYLKGVYRGYLSVGRPLKEALLIHSIDVKDGSPIKHRLQQVTILAYPGCIEENTIVKVKSRRCRECDTPFIPVVWNDQHCCKICATKGKQKRKNQTFAEMVKALFK